MKKATPLLILLAMAAPLLAADAPDRAPQLPPIDAGTILNQINNQHPFPPPVQTTLDTCVMTGFKNNKCYFKCQSGAILIEPAIKPDFSTGEPAAQCASYIIRPLPAPAFKTNRADLAWKNLTLQAADGTKIKIDYAPMDLGGTMMANPLWITVGGRKFTGSEKVRVALMTYYEATASSADSLKETKELNLPYNGTAFQAQGPEVSIYEGHHAWTHTFRQEIAVSVNGNWLTDPVNGSHNFKFKLAR
ncbi:MAG: hypothetical protein PHV36_08115 [Elusimicrobiales bacterium]|nr:hypothetical protein [Elusimicrobiales bacterium]